jgi:hypothetical protein
MTDLSTVRLIELDGLRFGYRFRVVLDRDDKTEVVYGPPPLPVLRHPLDELKAYFADDPDRDALIAMGWQILKAAGTAEPPLASPVSPPRIAAVDRANQALDHLEAEWASEEPWIFEEARDKVARSGLSRWPWIAGQLLYEVKRTIDHDAAGMEDGRRLEEGILRRPHARPIRAALIDETRRDVAWLYEHHAHDRSPAWIARGAGISDRTVRRRIDEAARVLDLGGHDATVGVWAAPYVARTEH